MSGGAIMIIGVAIQITAFKGHNATAQLIIGRTITGVGNGMVSFTISAMNLLTNVFPRTHRLFQHGKLNVRALRTVVFSSVLREVLLLLVL